MRAQQATNDLAAIISAYHEKALVYHDFIAAMRNILVSLLDDGGFKYQISHRLKSVDSIREKVRRNAALGVRYRRLADVEDLAGIRIVFLLESEKLRFQSALLGELTRDRLSLEEHHKASGYRATHVLARLGRKRIALREYRRFAGLKCEIQLTSALYHAWSEIEHDILYKRTGGAGRLAPAVVQRIQQQMADALRDHLEKAAALLEVAAARALRARDRPAGHGRAATARSRARGR